MTADPPAAAIVVAAGRGARMGASVAKAFLSLAGRPMLAHTVEAVERAQSVAEVVVVVAPADVEATQALLARRGPGKVAAVVAGGAQRQDSVFAGLQRTGDAGVVVVHDGARPLVDPTVIDAVAAAAARTGAASAGLPMRETVKDVDAGSVTTTLDRSRLWIAHTPQAFRAELLREAHRRAREHGTQASDDAALVESLGHRVQMVVDSPSNLKITVPDDLEMAEALLARRSGSGVRTGVGVDAHRLVMDRPLILGGVAIPSPRGLAGHSDADVLAHAITDAVLGAVGLGDIGTHFPPDDPAYKDADSLDLLARAVEMVRSAGGRVVHVDATVLAEAPRLGPYVAEMRVRLAGVLAVDPSAVNVKATTMEGMGAVGRGEGIVAHAVATISGIRGLGD